VLVHAGFVARGPHRADQQFRRDVPRRPPAGRRGVGAAAEAAGGAVEGVDAHVERGRDAGGGAGEGVVEVESQGFALAELEGGEEGAGVIDGRGAEGVAEVEFGGVPRGVAVEEGEEVIGDPPDAGGRDRALEGAGDGAGDVEADAHTGGQCSWDDRGETVECPGDRGVGVAEAEGLGGGGEEGDLEGESGVGIVKSEGAVEAFFVGDEDRIDRSGVREGIVRVLRFGDSEDFIGVGELWDPGGADEAGEFDFVEAGVGEEIDEGEFGVGGDGLGVGGEWFVLEAVAGGDIGDADARGHGGDQYGRPALVGMSSAVSGWPSGPLEMTVRAAGLPGAAGLAVNRKGLPQVSLNEEGSAPISW